jgi:putative membrane protein
MRERDLLILVAVTFVFLALIFSAGMGGGMMGGWMGMGGWGWNPILMLGFLLLISAGVYLLLTGSSLSEGRGDDRPLEIARERYARGEITREELEEIKKDLS